MAQQTVPKAGDQEILGHWIWAVPILLFVAVLGVRQIDLYAPAADEFYSMYNSGWIINSPYSPIDVLQSLERNSANHTAFYFLLLNFWGQLVGYYVALGRTLTIFAGLLSLAMAYRLCRDFVAPVAGLSALIIVASNAMYNYFIPYTRMYALLVLLSTVVFWLYLRIVYQQSETKRTDYLLLGASCYALANTHAFSALFFLMLGVYHLILVKKGKRWLRVAFTVAMALLLFSPWAIVLVTKGIDRTFVYWSTGTATVRQIFEAWFAVTFNGSWLLPLFSVAGIVAAIRSKSIRIAPYHFAFLLFLLALGLVAQLTNALGVGRVRLMLTGWLPVVLFVSCGMYSLYRIRKLYILLVLLIIPLGIWYETKADWPSLLRGRVATLPLPPWHAISRIAQQSALVDAVLGYRFDATILTWPGHIDYPQHNYYFANHGIDVTSVDDLHALEDFVRFRAITEPAIMLFHRKTEVDASIAAKLEAIMAGVNYEPCDQSTVGIDTVVAEYRWTSLDCREPQALSSQRTALLDYEFYGASVDDAGAKIAFADKWLSRGDLDPASHRFSHQLIGDGWENVAQLDLPLVHEDSLRQFSIDISDVPAGNYRLMVILYDNQTSERFNWIDNSGDPPYIQVLTEVVIAE